MNDPTDIGSPQLAGGLSSYPNAASGEVMLRSSASLRGARVTLHGMTGQTLQVWNGADAVTLMLDVSGVAPGVYVAKVARPDGVQRVRLVKR